jgi:hypothetical protein
MKVTALALVLVAFVNPLAAQTKAKSKARPTPLASPTAIPVTQEEKAALSALRAYHSVRDSGEREAVERYYLDAKVKIEQLPASATATRIQDAFAPTLRVTAERQAADRSQKYNDAMTNIQLIGSRAGGQKYDFDAERKANVEKALAMARENIERDKREFPEFGDAFEKKMASQAAAFTAKGGTMPADASLLNAIAWPLLDSIGAERTRALVESLK